MILTRKTLNLLLFILAALTKGTSIFKGIGDLANKESNRITEMQKILNQVGIKSVFKKGVLKIFGKGLIEASSKKIKLKNLGDHRLCMSTFILATFTGANAAIINFETVNTSAPSFKNCGASIMASAKVICSKLSLSMMMNQKVKPPWAKLTIIMKK